MSQLEESLLEQISKALLAPPQTQHKFHPSRKWLFDFAWPEYMLACEVQGGTFIRGAHSRGKSMQKDMEKLNAAQNAGWRVIQVDTEMVRDGRALEIIKGSILMPIHTWKAFPIGV